MAVTVQTLIDRFPELANVNDLASYLAEAERSHNATQWGPRSDDALSYLTAHLATMFGGGAGGGASGGGCGSPGPGPITSEREGQVAVSYAISDAAKNSEYGSTSYGRRYLQLVRTAFPARCI